VVRYTPLALVVFAGCTLIACNGGEEVKPQPAPECDTWYPDGDGDRFGDMDGTAVLVCPGDLTAGLAENNGDCDDTDPEINPVATEVCDLFRVDENCNGLSDEDDPAVRGQVETWPDADGDGAGDSSATSEPACPGADGRVVNTNDCDDTDPNLYVGAALTSPELCAEDVDGDGRAAESPLNPLAMAGTDCDDNNNEVFPGALEIFAGGIDNNCDGELFYVINESFETGAPDDVAWLSLTGNGGVSSDYAHHGQYSLNLEASDTELLSVPMRLDNCLDAGLLVVAWIKRGPETPDNNETAELQIFNGVEWITVVEVEGGEGIDPAFIKYRARVTDPTLLTANAQLRFKHEGSASQNIDDFFVDAVTIDCSGIDNDGDGFGENLDCDDTDEHHWSDCGACVDNDGDSYGLDCDLGADCDDGNVDHFPGATDVLGDGVDADCSGVDGPGFSDDLETGAVHEFAWALLDGPVTVTNAYAASGMYSVQMESMLAELRTTNIDMSVCPAASLQYSVKRGPDAPDVGANLDVEFFDSARWVLLETIEGDGMLDDEFTVHSVPIRHMGAYTSEFSLRFLATGGTAGADHFFLDDISLTCDEDADGDLVADVADCAPDDPLHWFDCGVCVDTDFDGQGPDCDLGDNDCDPNDGTVYYGAPDPKGDGIDSDCSTADGVGINEDFETDGVLSPAWSEFSGQSRLSTVWSSSGQWSMSLYGESGYAETIPFSTLACDLGVVMAWSGKRGPELPDNGDDVLIEYWDGTGWVVTYQWLGGAIDPNFLAHEFTLPPEPGTQHDEFKVRMTSNGTSCFCDEFFLDDLIITCLLGDADGNGVDDAFD